MCNLRNVLFRRIFNTFANLDVVCCRCIQSKHTHSPFDSLRSLSSHILAIIFRNYTTVAHSHILCTEPENPPFPLDCAIAVSFDMNATTVQFNRSKLVFVQYWSNRRSSSPSVLESQQLHRSLRRCMVHIWMALSCKSFSTRFPSTNAFITQRHSRAREKY